jgi:hypothetical protein
MKTTRFVVSLVVVTFLAVAGSASAATNYEAKAKNAAQKAGCIQPGQKNLTVNVEITSACFASGFITTATIIDNPGVVCSPEGGCLPALPVVVAQVQFGCDDEVMSVSCY